MKALVAFIVSACVFALPLEAVLPGAFTNKTVMKPGSAFQTASDSFAYTNTSLLGSQPNWTNIVGTIIVYNNGTASGCSGNAAGDNVCLYNQLTWASNQYCQYYYVNVNGTSAVAGGPGVRLTLTGGGTGYYLTCLSGTIYVNMISGGSTSNLTNFAQAVSVGTGVRLSVVGSGSSTRLTVSIDSGSGFVAVFSNYDPGTYFSSGSPGLCGSGSGGNQADMSLWFASEQ